MTMELMETKPAVSLGTLTAAKPTELVRGATDIANQLAEVIESRKLFVGISGKRYVRVEGWTTLAALCGCTIREIEAVALDDGSYVATVELVRLNDGFVVGRASSECAVDEKRWKNADRYARRSMAVTRASGKACRLAFSWILALAGHYETTPAEEMPMPELPAPPPPKPKKGPDIKRIQDRLADVAAKIADAEDVPVEQVLFDLGAGDSVAQVRTRADVERVTKNLSEKWPEFINGHGH